MKTENITIKTIKENTKNKNILNLINYIKKLGATILIPQYLIDKHKNIKYFTFYLNKNFYTIEENYFGFIDLIIKNKPSKDFGTGSYIINNGLYKDILDILKKLPNQNSIWNNNLKKRPEFYNGLNEYYKKSYFDLYKF